MDILKLKVAHVFMLHHHYFLKLNKQDFIASFLDFFIIWFGGFT